MSDAADFASGKDSGDENFPVASRLVAPRYRPTIMAFYRVARLADDVADHASASPEEKLATLAGIEDTLLGRANDSLEAVALREALVERGLGPQHMLDLLEAFRRDVTKLRYRDWGELMDYCRYSAAPVGRFVLDVHGESRSAWPASDALCAALQVINHLQDCGKDFRQIGRVYVPQDALQAFGARTEMLGGDESDPKLLGALKALAWRTEELLRASRGFPGQVKDLRLALEIGAIQRMGESLLRRLTRRDPLSQEMHHNRWEAIGVGLIGVGRTLGERLGPRQTAPAAS